MRRGLGVAAGLGVVLLGLFVRASLDADDAAPAVGAARVEASSPVSRPAGALAAGGATAPIAAERVSADSPRTDREPVPEGAGIALLVRATPTLKVGETGELSISLDARRPLGEVSLVLRFDPDRLQAREGEADGAVLSPKAAGAARESSVGDAGDRVAIRIRRVPDDLSSGDGPLVVQTFQGMAPGRTKVAIERVVVVDPLGRSLPWTVSAAEVSVLVVSEAF